MPANKQNKPTVKEKKKSLKNQRDIGKIEQNLYLYTIKIIAKMLVRSCTRTCIKTYSEYFSK